MRQFPVVDGLLSHLEPLSQLDIDEALRAQLPGRFRVLRLVFVLALIPLGVLIALWCRHLSLHKIKFQCPTLDLSETGLHRRLAVIPSVLRQRLAVQRPITSATHEARP